MSRQTKVRTPKEIEQIFNVLRVIVAIVIAMLFAFLVVLFVSEEPLDSISKFIFGPFATMRRFGEIISKMIPLLFTGVAVCCLLGGLFGMAACFIPAIMYVKCNSKPIVSSLMVNYVCMYLAVGLINHAMRDNSAGYNASATFDKTAVLPKLVRGTDIHLGLRYPSGTAGTGEHHPGDHYYAGGGRTFSL